MKKTIFYSLVCLAVSISLSIYSYALTDLSLTLSENYAVLFFQKNLQQLGYFHREASTAIYFVLILSLIILYLKIGKIISGLSRFQKSAIIVSFIIPFLVSYSAMISYDIFNYIFDSRIITVFHQNPYTHTALDFPSDPMVHYMRWTHRAYPYGPIWLIPGVVITLFSSKLLIQLFLFKTLSVSVVLYCVKLLRKNSQTRALLFLFNPLVVIEVFISNHNDIFVSLFLIISIIFFNRKKISLLSSAIGFLVKYSNVFLIPVIIFFKKPSRQFYLVGYFSILFSVILASLRTEFQPWYILWLLPFAYLADRNSFIAKATIITSILLPFAYLPYIFTGSYDGLSFYLKYILISVSIIITIIFNRRLNRIL